METTVELTRKPVEVNQALFSREHGDFMKLAKKVLGYRGMEPALDLNKAAVIFKVLGIEPLDEEKVREYKMEMQREANRHNYTQLWVWTAKHLDDYKKPVPQFVLSRAIELKKAFDKEGIEASFRVEELTRFERTADPFLFVRIHDKDFYLDVWDEPKFEGRRVK